jgi:RNA polymerase sigma-70 factor, ECF subfamily
VRRSDRQSGVSGSDAAEFAAWVEPHWSAMTGLAWRLVAASDVDDVVQEALASAWRQRDRFDPARGTPRAWLLALIADQARRSRRRGRRLPVPVDRIEPGAHEDQRIDHELAEAVGQLSHRQRLAVELFYYVGLPVADVAEVMGCAVGTVKSTLADARGRLRNALNRRGDDG